MLRLATLFYQRFKFKFFDFFLQKKEDYENDEKRPATEERGTDTITEGKDEKVLNYTEIDISSLKVSLSYFTKENYSLINTMPTFVNFNQTNIWTKYYFFLINMSPISNSWKIHIPPPLKKCTFKNCRLLIFLRRPFTSPF